MTDTHKAQPEQEPVYQIKVYGSQTAWHDADSSVYDLTPPNKRRILYTTPPQREPLTDGQFMKIKASLSTRDPSWDGDAWDFALKEAIEEFHGIKE